MDDVTCTRQSISLTGATNLVAAAIERAKVANVNVVVCVVDESGITKVSARMDGAPLMAIELARRKAVTAVGYSLPTGDAWYGFVKDDPLLLEGARTIPDFTMLGGGVPIVVGDAVVGAIGVSGGHYRQDEECAHAALLALTQRG
jgi:uncharacterized protein GlcG (DUF336 family)